MIATRVVQAVLNWNKRILANRVGVGLTFELRSQLVQKLHKQGIGYFDRHETGALTNRVVNDSEVLHSLVQQVTGGFLLQIVVVVAVGAMLFLLNPKLAILTLIPAPLVFAGSMFFWRRVYPNYYRYWEHNAKQAGSVSGLISGMRVVKAFAQEPRELERFEAASGNVRQSRVTVDRATASYSAVFSFVFGLGGLIVWYAGGRDVLGGEMTLGELMAFFAYLGMFYEPLSTLSEFTTWLTSVMTGCQRVFELLDAPAETSEPANPEPCPNVRGEIRFEQRHLRLRTQSAGAQGHHLHHSRGRTCRHRRQERQRQVDARQPDQPVLRRSKRPRDTRRRRCSQRRDRGPAPQRGCRASGAVSVPRDYRGQPCLRPAASERG